MSHSASGACAVLFSRVRLGTKRGHQAKPHSLQAAQRPVTIIATASRPHTLPAGELAPLRQRELRELTVPPSGRQGRASALGAGGRPSVLSPAPPSPTPLPQAVAMLKARDIHRLST